MATRSKLQGGRTDRETFDRALILAGELFAGRELTAKRVMQLTGVALSTAHRDLWALEAVLPVECEEVHQKPWPNPRKVLRLMRSNAGIEPGRRDHFVDATKMVGGGLGSNELLAG